MLHTAFTLWLSVDNFLMYKNDIILHTLYSAFMPSFAPPPFLVPSGLEQIWNVAPLCTEPAPHGALHVEAVTGSG